jgi:hypothetical protein
MRRVLWLLLPAFLIGAQLATMSLPLLRPCDQAGHCAQGNDCRTTCPQCPCSVQGHSGLVVTWDAPRPMAPIARIRSHTVVFCLPVNPTSIFHVPKPTLV